MASLSGRKNKTKSGSRRFSLFYGRLRIHPLFLLLGLWNTLVGNLGVFFCSVVCAVLHELAHAAQAAKLGYTAKQLLLMPYGAAIRLNNLWETHPLKLIAISLAGPFANLIVSAFLSLFLTLVPAHQALYIPLIKNGAALAFINLIPALPLDGGRCLSALLSLKTGMAKAVNAGVVLGRIFSLLLFASALLSFFRYEKLPLFPILCAIYIFSSGTQEKRHAQGAALRAKLLRSRTENAVSRAAVILSDRSVPVYEAVKFVYPDERAIYAVTDEAGRIVSVLSDSRIASALIENASGNIGDIR